MKATLKFSLPEEKTEHELASKAGELAATLFDLDDYLRGRLKHEQLSNAATLALQAARDKLHEIAVDRGVSIALDG